MPITWRRSLSWRLNRQLLDPPAARSVVDVVRRLGAVSAWPDANAEIAVAARRTKPRAGEVASALADGRVIKTFAFRGGTYLLTPEEGGIYLALRASSRMWELRSWQEYYRLAPDDWPRFREAVRDAMNDGALTQAELAEKLALKRAYRHLRELLSHTLLKPLGWQGDLCFGPTRDGQPTYQRLDLLPRWAGIPDLEVAGPAAVESYLSVSGPATVEQIHYFLGNGLSVRPKLLLSWVERLGDRLATVDIEGTQTLMRRKDLDELASSQESTTVHLLPGYDHWVMGTGTKDAQVVPPTHRPTVSRGSHLVVVGGVVSGTWSVKGERLRVSAWGSGGGVRKLEEAAVAAAAARLAPVLGRSLEVVIERA